MFKMPAIYLGAMSIQKCCTTIRCVIKILEEVKDKK